MQFYLPYIRLVLLLAVSLLIFALARLSLYLIYSDDFVMLDNMTVFYAFLYGMRFDLSAIIKMIGLPLFLSVLPFAWARRATWQRFCGWWVFVGLLISIVLLIADLIYFGFVNRHAGAEIQLLTGDPVLMLDIAFSEHGGKLTALILLGIVAAIGWHRIMKNNPLTVVHHRPVHGVIAVAALALLIIGGRGGVQYKPVSVADAFTVSPSAGYLALNGAFAIQHALGRSAPKKLHFLPDQDATQYTRETVVAPGETFLRDDYPLLRRNAVPSSHTKPNVVVILFESWDAIHTDILRARQGLPSLKATPYFDALAKEGRLYDNFFANGRRSMDGIAATLASIPTLPGMPYIGKGLEQNRLAYLGKLGQAQGYKTLFLQSSMRGSFHLDAIAAQAGFDTYLGAEDIPRIASHSEISSEWGVWDYETLVEADRQFKKATQPFLGFIFTSTTHNPWRVPSRKWEVRPSDENESRFLNTLNYVDWALGQFIKSAKQNGYYDNTIFILTGDHISRFNVDPQDARSRYRVPLLVVGPGIEPGIDSRLGSQLDLLPTIAELAQWQTTHASVGRSLLAPPRTDGIFAVNGNMIEWITQDGWISHNLEKVVEASPPIKPDDAQLKRLLAIEQTVQGALLENKVYR